MNEENAKDLSIKILKQSTHLERISYNLASINILLLNNYLQQAIYYCFSQQEKYVQSSYETLTDFNTGINWAYTEDLMIFSHMYISLSQSYYLYQSQKPNFVIAKSHFPRIKLKHFLK